MSPVEYRELLERAGLSQIGAARLFKVNPKTSRRWASEKDPQDIPAAVEIALRLMVRFGVTADEASGLASKSDASAGE